MLSMKKTIGATVGSAALLLSAGAMAGPPTAFDAWLFDPAAGTGGFFALDGVTPLANSCDAAFTCGNTIEDGGFFQRPITNNATGEQYFQTIIVDDNLAPAGQNGSSAQAFADENFVGQLLGNGIADKQSIEDLVASGLVADTTILNGWAVAAGDDVITINQSLFTTDAVTQETMNSTFSMLKDTLGDTAIDMTQDLGLGSDSQNFSFNQRSGSYQGTARTGAELTTLMVGGEDAAGNPSEDMTWAAGDEVKKVRVGQSVTDGAVAQIFGFEEWQTTDAATGLITQTVRRVSFDAAPFPTPFNGITGVVGEDPFL